ncbi:hypothetical protein [Kaarinaea lacus]
MTLKRFVIAIVLTIFAVYSYLIYPRIAYDFIAFDEAHKIFYQPGAEDLVQLVASNLSASLEKVQQAQFVPFKNIDAIKIYIFNDIDRYARFSRASKLTRGSSTTDEVYLSAKLRDKISTLPGILIHELSHVHIRQYTGTWRYIRDVPGWFLEGMGVLTSSGAGAESVSSQEALQYLKGGTAFILQDSGGIIAHKTAHDYGLKPHMYYRLSSLYVDYLRQVDSLAFENAFKDILQQSSYHDAWTKHYGKTNTVLWQGFLTSAE